MTGQTDEWIDPFEAHAMREPLPGAGVRVVAFAGDDAARARDIATGIAVLLAERDREAEVVVVESRDGRAHRP